MTTPFHEHVSGVAPLDGALDGSKKPAKRRAPKTTPTVAELKSIPFCPGCGLRGDSEEIGNDPQAMHRHMVKEMTELREGLGQTQRVTQEEFGTTDREVGNLSWLRNLASKAQILAVTGDQGAAGLLAGRYRVFFGHDPSALFVECYPCGEPLPSGRHAWGHVWLDTVYRTPEGLLCYPDVDEILHRLHGHDKKRRGGLSGHKTNAEIATEDRERRAAAMLRNAMRSARQ